jgi:hypothetical protein
MRVYAAALALVLVAVVLPAVVAAGAPSDAAQTGRPPAEAAEGTPAPTRPYPWNRRIGAAGRFARRRAGLVSWAVVSPDGRVRGSHIHRQHTSASVVKAMLMVAYLRKIPRRALRRRDRALLRPMVTSSDNRAATRVNAIVGNGLPRLARRAKMRDFAYAGGSWGGTQVSPYDQARFFWRIERFVPPRHRAYARSLLAGIVGPQRWGVPPVAPRGWRIFFKGGWVPPRRVNQVALLQRGRTRVAIAVFNQGTPSFRYGRETIQGVADRVLLRINSFRP